jgi:high-affinity nickel-transport protein
MLVLSVVLLGFFLGVRHATDADHVIAVATIVSRERRIAPSALIGALWGVGHTFTIFVVGGVIILFGVVIPPRLGLTMEFAVAVMLILLGVMSLTGTLGRITGSLSARAGGHVGFHAHAHRHGDYVHDHPHAHDQSPHGHAEEQTPLGRLDHLFGRLGVYHVARPLVIGLVHGLAGSAAVALLVLATIRDPLWGVVYLLVFGVGTIAGMMLITAALAIPFAYTARNLGQLNRYLGIAAGVLSIVFGLILGYQIGFVDGLFSSDPRWNPE